MDGDDGKAGAWPWADAGRYTENHGYDDGKRIWGNIKTLPYAASTDRRKEKTAFQRYPGSHTSKGEEGETGEKICGRVSKGRFCIRTTIWSCTASGKGNRRKGKKDKRILCKTAGGRG